MSVDVAAEIAAGQISAEGYRQLVQAEVYGQASTVGWLEARLAELRAALRVGKAIRLTAPGRSVTLASEDELHAWCNEELPDAYACFLRAEGGWFPHLRLAAAPPRSWREAYEIDAARLRESAAADPFARRETAGPVESAEIEARFANGVRAAIGGDDFELATAFFGHAVRLGERLRAAARADGGPSSPRPLDVARDARLECLAGLFVAGTWDRHTFANGLAAATTWCFGPASAVGSDRPAIQAAVLTTLRMALMGGGRDVFGRLWARVERLPPVQDMLLWREVARETSPARQSALVREYVAGCPKGDDGSIEGDATYQLELAMVALSLAGTRPERVTLRALTDLVCASGASET